MKMLGREIMRLKVHGSVECPGDLLLQDCLQSTMS